MIGKEAFKGGDLAIVKLTTICTNKDDVKTYSYPNRDDSLGRRSSGLKVRKRGGWRGRGVQQADIRADDNEGRSGFTIAREAEKGWIVSVQRGN